jgi:hypothetical protein
MTDTRCFFCFSVFLSLSSATVLLLTALFLLCFFPFSLSVFPSFRHVHVQVEDDDTQGSGENLQKKDAGRCSSARVLLLFLLLSCFVFTSACSPLISPSSSFHGF